MKQVEVRKATREDVLAISQITAEAFHKYALDLGMPQSVGALRETPKDVLKDVQHKHVYIALLDGEPVGSIRFEVLGGKVAYISRFGVRLIAQGCGVGHTLIKVVEAKCRKLGLSAMALHTSSRMSSLVRFYYGSGFFIHSTSIERGYIRALLIKDLADSPDLDYVDLVNGR